MRKISFPTMIELLFLPLFSGLEINERSSKRQDGPEIKNNTYINFTN